MTVERPKALLPLVNVPMIAYTLEWLVAAGIEEVFAHGALYCMHGTATPHDRSQRSMAVSRDRAAILVIAGPGVQGLVVNARSAG